MKRNHVMLAGLFAILVPALVWAGKAERDQRARLEPKVAEQDAMDPVMKGKTLVVHSAEGQANRDGQVSEILRKL